MNRAFLLPAAYLADHLAGDPEWFPHPVRLIGFAISRSESVLSRPDDTPAQSVLKGLLVAASIPAAAWLVTRALLRAARLQSPFLGDAAELALAWTTLAARNLQDEASSVERALHANNLPLARTRLARIVGRDTHSLNAQETSRALIETLAESASDGIIAPMFFLALGGAPLAMAYKAVNTLDSIIGHRTPRYLYFGKASARLDDAANFLPARLTALTLIAMAPNHVRAWRTWRKDRARHKSPNAGQPEAAMAGALGVRLGGSNTYNGELIAAAELGSTFPAPEAADARKAKKLTTRAALLGLAVCTLFTLTLHRKRHA